MRPKHNYNIRFDKTFTAFYMMNMLKSLGLKIGFTYLDCRDFVDRVHGY